MFCLRTMLAYQDTINRMILQVRVLQLFDGAVLSERVGAVWGEVSDRRHYEKSASV
jgi:hypothetical protein